MIRQCLIGAVLGAGLLGTALAQEESRTPGAAQDPGAQAAPEPTYFPLFSDEMIQNASPEQAARMRETETRNRAAFDARQEKLREQRQQAEQAASASQAPPPPPANSPRRGKSKIFKWVDANGRVHFGDAPQGQDAKEVKVGGVARQQGTPPPAPASSSGKPVDPD